MGNFINPLKYQLTQSLVVAFFSIFLFDVNLFSQTKVNVTTAFTKWAALQISCSYQKISTTGANANQNSVFKGLISSDFSRTICVWSYMEVGQFWI